MISAAFVCGRRQVKLWERAQQFGWMYVECLCKHDDHIEGGIAPGALQSADVSAVECRMVCELPLRSPASFPAELAQVVAESDAMRRGCGHVSTIPLCRRSVHGL